MAKAKKVQQDPDTANKGMRECREAEKTYTRDKKKLLKLALETAAVLEQEKLAPKRGGFYEDKDGKHWSRVTTICGMLDKPALVGWAANTAIDCVHAVWYKGDLQEHDFEIAKKAWRAHSAKAINIGKDVHNLIERRITEKLDLAELVTPAMPKEVKKAIAAFTDFEKRYIDTWLLSECPVRSKTMKAAGTIDAVAVMKEPAGKIYIVDFKTSTGIYEEAFLQVAAYMETWCELVKAGTVPVDMAVEGTLVARFDKRTGMPSWYDCTELMPTGRAAFKQLAKFAEAKLAFNEVVPDWRDLK